MHSWGLVSNVEEQWMAWVGFEPAIFGLQGIYALLVILIHLHNLPKQPSHSYEGNWGEHKEHIYSRCKCMQNKVCVSIFGIPIPRAKCLELSCTCTIMHCLMFISFLGKFISSMAFEIYTWFWCCVPSGKKNITDLLLWLLLEKKEYISLCNVNNEFTQSK